MAVFTESEYFKSIQKTIELIKNTVALNPSIIQLVEEVNINFEKRKDYIINYDCARTTTNNFFSYNLKLQPLPTHNYLLNDLNLLVKKLNANNTIYESNVEMSYVFASNLNEVYVYLNSFLVKVILIFEPDYNVFGKEGGEDNTSIPVLLEKIKEHCNNEADKKILKEIKIYFSLFSVIVRNFYSHGWLNLFPILTLRKNLAYSFKLGYDLDNENKAVATNLNIEFFDIDIFINEYTEILKRQKFSEDEIQNLTNSNFYSGYKLEKQSNARNFLRRVSLSEITKTILYEDFPEAILIFRTKDNNEYLVYNESVAFDYINKLIDILNILLITNKNLN